MSDDLRRSRWRGFAVVVAVMGVVIAVCAVVGGESRPGSVDIGDWLQRRLDRGGGFVFLPRLGGGRCYVSRGLWVSRSDTTIVSNGACIRVLGPGPVRLRSADGDPIAASAAFFISRSAATIEPPTHVSIRGLRIHVPPGAVDGIDVYARDVAIIDVRVDGAPFDDVYIGGRTNLIAYSRRVSVTGSTLLDAQRNVISVTAAVDVRIGGNTIAGAGIDSGPAADPGDGIDVEPNATTDPIVGLRIADNTIVGNIHQGIALRLNPHGHRLTQAGRISIVGNLIAGNSAYGGGAQIALPSATGEPRRVQFARNRFVARLP